MRFLLSMTACVEMRNEDGKTPLVVARPDPVMDLLKQVIIDKAAGTYVPPPPYSVPPPTHVGGWLSVRDGGGVDEYYWPHTHYRWEATCKYARVQGFNSAAAGAM